MAERATVFQTMPFAPETTYGTAVTTGFLISTYDGTLSIATAGRDPQYAEGHRGAQYVPGGQEWSTFTMRGRGLYKDTAYILQSLLGVVAGVQDATSGIYDYIYNVSDTGLITPKSYTIIKGDAAVRAAQAAGCVFTDLDFHASRQMVELTANGIGQLFTDGATYPSSPVRIPPTPILGSTSDVYMDPVGSAYGTTALTRNFDYRLRVGALHGPVWPMQSSLPSFAGTVNVRTTMALDLLLEADAVGMGLLLLLRQSANLKRIRIKFTGDTLSTSAWSLTIDVCGALTTPNPMQDGGGVYDMPWTFNAVPDPTTGFLATIKLSIAAATL